MVEAREPLLSCTATWADVTPVRLPDEARSAINIRYTEHYEDAFGLLYACMAAAEKTARVLKLTEKCIALCSSHYTAWDYRFQARRCASCCTPYRKCACDLRIQCAHTAGGPMTRPAALQCLMALDADMESEWALCWAIAEANCKNYQLWNHRRRCAMRMGAHNAARELEFAAHFLEQDAKNYHIWAHRQVRHF